MQPQPLGSRSGIWDSGFQDYRFFRAQANYPVSSQFCFWKREIPAESLELLTDRRAISASLKSDNANR
jgi:hypothetical protein